jgi:hypothetical protein
MAKTIVAVLLGTLPTWAFATSWVNVPLLDRTCAETARAEPDGHPRDCLLQCAASGFGILDHGTWVPLDEAGDEKALAALRSMTRKDHVRVNVTGERVGAVIQVTSLTLAE